MKNLKLYNFTLILFTLFFVAGCLPDSLTKFSKTSSNQNSKAPEVKDSSTGTIVSKDEITYPTTFTYKKLTEPVTEILLEVGTDYTSSYLTPVLDGSIGNETQKQSFFSRCELDTSSGGKSAVLPSGIYFSTKYCSIYGNPIASYSDIAPNLGKTVPYNIRYYFKNAKGLSGVNGAVNCISTTECYIATTIRIGAYIKPNNLTYTQNDKLGITLKNLGVNGVNVFTVDDRSNSINTDILFSNQGTMGLIQFIDSNNKLVYLSKSFPITVANAALFNTGDEVGTFDRINLNNTTSVAVGDTIAAGTYSGNIIAVGSSFVHVYRNASSSTTAPSGTATITHTDNTTTPATITTQSKVISAGSSVTTAKVGRILFVDTTNNLIKIAQYPTYTALFATGDIISPPGTITTTTVSSLDLTTLYSPGDQVDNDTQFYSSKGTVEDSLDKLPIQFYAVGNAITPISPIVTTNPSLNSSNGITYSISPSALPTGLNFNTTTGVISGTFTKVFEPTTFTITATNPMGSSSKSLRIAAIFAPKDLSYTQNQIVSVSNTQTYPNSVFVEGEDLFLPIEAPATESVTGKLLRKISTNLLTLETRNGSFAPGKSIDFGTRFVAERASVPTTSTTYDYNLVIGLNSTAGFTVGGYVTNNSGAKARIIFIDSTRSTLYVQFLTPDVSNVGLFSEGEDVDNVSPYVTNRTFITRIEAKNYLLTLLDASSFTTSGLDISACSTAGCAVGASKVAGYVYSLNSTSNVLGVTDTTRTVSQFTVPTSPVHQSEFLNGQFVDVGENYISSKTTISRVSHENFWAFARNEYIEVRSQISQGSNLSFSITPNLPEGLKINPNTGLIYGKPTLMTPKKQYVITAKNLLGSSDYVVSIEIRDYFTLSHKTDAVSPILHKYGETQNMRKCRINGSDILNEQGQRDITCFMEVQEEDIIFAKLKLMTSSGSGICEYISYKPYSLMQFRPNLTSISEMAQVNYINGCTNFPGAPSDFTLQTPAANNMFFCPGNWNALEPSFPNCDGTSFNVRTFNSSVNDSGNCVLNSQSDQTIKCGGNALACKVGPIEDILKRDQINSGFTGMIYQILNSQDISWEHKAPIEFADITTKRIANFTYKNNSGSSPTEITAAEVAQNLIDPTHSPFSTLTQPNYTFECLDAARDRKARITLRIRDWDRAFRLNDNIDLDSTTRPPKMDVSPFNNYTDWDDDSFANYSGLTTTTQASCSDGVSQNPTECRNNSGVWSLGSNFRFPMDNL